MSIPLFCLTKSETRLGVCVAKMMEGKSISRFGETHVKAKMRKSIFGKLQALQCTEKNSKMKRKYGRIHEI